VLDDQLAARAEKVREGDRTVRSLEQVGLGDLDHREPAAVGVEGIAGAGELLLLREQAAPGLEPLLAGYDVGKTHRCLLGG